MKKVLCAIIAGAICSSTAVGLAGCGCSDNQEPGYKIVATEPDLENGDFGYYIINSNELMITRYTGTEKDVEIPESYNGYTVTAIGACAFIDADMETVTMPDTITDIQEYAFSSCGKLKSIRLSENLETVGNSAFFTCSSLESISIPASVKNLGMYTFSGSGIKSAEIAEGNLTRLDHYVFYQCPKLTEVTIPPQVTYMEDDSISDCPNTVTVKAASGTYAANYANTHDGVEFEATDKNN